MTYRERVLGSHLWTDVTAAKIIAHAAVDDRVTKQVVAFAEEWLQLSPSIEE